MKPLSVVISEVGLDELRRVFSSERDDVDFRVHVHGVYLVASGMTPPQAAAVLGVGSSSVRRWVHAFNQRGLAGLRRKPHPGKTPRLSREQKRQLFEDVLRDPWDLGYGFGMWTAKTVRHHIQRRFRVSLGERQVNRILHEIGLSLQKPATADPRQEKGRKRRFRRWLKKN